MCCGAHGWPTSPSEIWRDLEAGSHVLDGSRRPHQGKGVRSGVYQLADESNTLQEAAAERERRRLRRE
eukprot:1210902-Pyramimonas_sp.AAC.1